MELVKVTLEYTGDKINVIWTIPPEAHSVGLPAMHGRTLLGMGDDLGSPEGAELIAEGLTIARDVITRSIHRAWGTSPLW